MKIRDGFSTINGIDTTYTMESGTVEIIADDGRTLWSINILENGKIDITTGTFCKHDGVVLGNKLKITPRASNCIILERKPFDES